MDEVRCCIEVIVEPDVEEFDISSHEEEQLFGGEGGIGPGVGSNTIAEAVAVVLASVVGPARDIELV